MNLQDICNERIFDKKYMISLSLNKEIKPRIIEYTDWMEEKTPLKIRCLAIYHSFNKENFPKCVVCGNPVTYDKEYLDKFLNYCGPICSRKHKHRLSNETYEKLNDYDWFYKQRFELKKSFETIALELNCSTAPVIKASKILNIPLIKHNESEPLTLSKLKDKKWLYETHVKQRKKVREIAEELNSSSATISRWLMIHDIKTNEPNS